MVWTLRAWRCVRERLQQLAAHTGGFVHCRAGAGAFPTHPAPFAAAAAGSCTLPSCTATAHALPVSR